jgi:hypothetical protein
MSIERVLIVFAVLVSLVLGGVHFGYIQIPARVASSTFTSNPVEAVVKLKHNKAPDIFRSLDANAQELLVNLVREHCSRSFDEQSCLHYAISCGRPCMAYLTKHERLRMLASYERLSSTQGGGL